MTQGKAVFTGDEGEIILAADAKTIKDGHKGRRKEIEEGGKDNYVEAEFFGLNTFNKLIANFKDECVGFRVYHGSRHEDHAGEGVKITKEGSAKRTSRVVIVPVDKYGNDLRSPRGLKDDSGSAVANGPLCPNKCAPPTND
ncbi:hypothetical protein DSL64_12660 [Dyadobacter luteus]|jgi:hypothetical protein|uniref:Uncharacterized protein n=1 Tax=Dyadobacter luteus TaxID=2259619 RepID=A0A3D8YC66_9BACT|nr:hypothetical protein [Dyadobacter luteus]REA61292.1 hypothetical protein DSL64_12660 [Dyadobacter luteus]